MKPFEYDEIGYWSKVKLDIIKDYATVYSQILSVQKTPALYHIYVDAFAGAGKHISERQAGFVTGSPMNALQVSPRSRNTISLSLTCTKRTPFKASWVAAPMFVYTSKTATLRFWTRFCLRHAGRTTVEHWSCWTRMGLHLNWNVLQTMGRMRSVEIFLNFPVADMNRNLLWHNPELVDHRDVDRMNAYWGMNPGTMSPTKTSRASGDQ